MRALQPDRRGDLLRFSIRVTSGYIRSQAIEAEDNVRQSSHFDIIIYDQLEAPTLWVEENRDKADRGRARIIPAENVGAVIEVKAAFNRTTVVDATARISQLVSERQIPSRFLGDGLLDHACITRASKIPPAVQRSAMLSW